VSFEQLAKKREEAAKALAVIDAELERVERLKAIYPDLKRHVGRWDKVAYCSPSVNHLVNKYEHRFNCGCCGDSPMELWPYVETHYGRVYSDPTGIFIGEKDPYLGGAVSRSGWREQLKGYGIPEALIEDVAQMFKDERDKAREAVEARYAEGAVTDEPEPLL